MSSTFPFEVKFSVQPDVDGHPASIGLVAVGPNRFWLWLESREGGKGVHLSRFDAVRLIRELDDCLQQAALKELTAFAARRRK